MLFSTPYPSLLFRIMEHFEGFFLFSPFYYACTRFILHLHIFH